MPVFVQELLTLYAHGGDAGALPRVTPYRDYLAWLAGQDRAAAVAAFGAALAGLEEPTLLAPPARGRAAVLPEQIMLPVNKGLSEALIAARHTRRSDAEQLHSGRLGGSAWASERAS